MEEGLWRPRSAHVQQTHLFNTHAQDWAKAIGYLIQSEVKSEREKQTWYINTCMWNLEKWYGSTHFQGRNRDTDAGDGHVDVAEVGWGLEELGDGESHTHRTACYQRASGSYCRALGAQLRAL